LKASEARRLEKERKQAEKKQQNEMKKALRKAATDTSKESRAPGDRVKKMTVVLEKALVESAEFMTELTTELSTLDVGYQVGSNDLYPGSVLWRRTISERTVDENARVNKIYHI
jgi:signal recognition particle GTPase